MNNARGDNTQSITRETVLALGGGLAAAIIYLLAREDFSQAAIPDIGITEQVLNDVVLITVLVLGQAGVMLSGALWPTSESAPWRRQMSSAMSTFATTWAGVVTLWLFYVQLSPLVSAGELTWWMIAPAVAFSAYLFVFAFVKKHPKRTLGLCAVLVILLTALAPLIIAVR